MLPHERFPYSYTTKTKQISLPSRLMRGVVPGKRPRRDPPGTIPETIGSTIVFLPCRLSPRSIHPSSPPYSRLTNITAAAAATTIGSILGSFAVAGALAGMLHGLTLHLNWFATPAGWGGKAGACAFLGVALYRACQRAAAWVQSKGRGGRRAV